jgi:hypothetical protein
MDKEGAHDEKKGGKGAHGEGESGLHVRPQPPYAPSFCKGAHESREGAHGAGNGQAAPGPEAEIAANGFAISHRPENRRPLEPGEVTCRVAIREIRHPAISAGPHDRLMILSPKLCWSG